MRRVCISAAALCLLGSLGAQPSRAQEQTPAPAGEGPVRAHVQLVTLGRFPRPWLEPIRAALESALDVQATIVERPLPLPRSAYYEPRRRYRAEQLTDHLNERFRGAPQSTRILGLTSRDISTTREPYHDWGILGLADVGGRAAVVSSFRMRRRARDAAHAQWRMTTTAVHEVGHLLGLDHCDEDRCLMRDAEGTMDTVDAGSGELGAGCRRLLRTLAPPILPRRP